MTRVLWRCPKCEGEFDVAAETLTCRSCAANYPLVAEIPDLRVAAPAWIDFDADRARALTIEGIVGAEGLEAAVLDVFRSSRRFDERKATFRKRQVYAGVGKCDAMIDGWLSGTLEAPVLDIGCGPGQFLAAVAGRGVAAAGLDVSLEWLVVAKHLVRSKGGRPELAAAMAEHLPVAAGAVRSIVSLDVIEHVGDQRAYAAEIARALAPGGRFALATPNRYSLSPEPHVGVWGVGYLPVPLQARWVRLVSGQSYEFTRLLSKREATRLLEGAGALRVDIHFPPIAEEEIALFPRAKAGLARLYNRVVRSGAFGPLMRFVGAYYRVNGVKAG